MKMKKNGGCGKILRCQFLINILRLGILYGMFQDKFSGVEIFFFLFRFAAESVSWQFIRFSKKQMLENFWEKPARCMFSSRGEKETIAFWSTSSAYTGRILFSEIAAQFYVFGTILPLVNNIEFESYHFDVSHVIYISTIIFRNHTGCNFTIELFNLTTLHA